MKWRGTSVDTAQLPAKAASLREQLAEIKANIEQYVRTEDSAINERAVAAITASGVVENVLKVGAPAPQFNLQDQNGRNVDSTELLKSGPLVIVFFRGRWCPFCMTSLEVWRETWPQIKATGASLVAVSPQLVRHNAFATDQHKLAFPVLSDPGNKIAKAFGIAYRVPDEQETLYKRVFTNLPHLNGDESWELSLPAVFVVGGDGKVIFREINADFTIRTEPSAVLKHLEVANKASGLR